MKQIFIDNPSLDVVYQTSDEKYFFTLNDAQNYAKTLENKEVIKLERVNEEKEDIPLEEENQSLENENQDSEPTIENEEKEVQPKKSKK